jgi:hypothetical protein
MRPFWRAVSPYMLVLFIGILAINAISLISIIASSFYNHSVIFDYGPDTPIKGKDILQVTSFISSTIVAILTPIVLAFAIIQFKHAENTKLASVFLDLSRRYNDSTIRYARQKIKEIEDKYPENKYTDECLQQYGTATG